MRIRLTGERWAHIVDGHPELSERRQEVLRAVAAPEEVFGGNCGELLGVIEMEPARWMVAVYREEAHDGFVITAFLMRRRAWLHRRRRLWP